MPVRLVMSFSRCARCALFAAVLLASFLAGAAVSAQFLPPPPAKEMVAEGGFTDRDRALVTQTHRIVRSIRAKLFPLDEENQILRMER